MRLPIVTPQVCADELELQDRRRLATYALVGERSIALPDHLDRFAHVTGRGGTHKVETFAVFDDALSAIADLARSGRRHLALGDLDDPAGGPGVRRISLRHNAAVERIRGSASEAPDGVRERGNQVIRTHHAQRRHADYRYGDVYLLLTQRPTSLIEFEWFPDRKAVTRRLVALVRVDDRFVGLWRPAGSTQQVAVGFTSTALGGIAGQGD